MKKIVSLFIMMVANIDSAYALTYESMMERSQETRSIYIAGLGEGFSWANSAAVVDDFRLYCQPNKLALNGRMYVQILDDFVARKEKTEPDIKQQEVGLLMYMALLDVFPCE